MKKFSLGVLTLFLSFLILSGCGNNNNTSSQKTTEESSNLQELAEDDANVILSYVYDGKSDGIDGVTNQSKKELDNYILEELKSKQLENYNDDNKLDDYYLIVDGSNYYASDILDDYAKAYLKTTQSLGSYKIKKIKINGDRAKVTAEITPFAGLSEANPIGTMRTSLFGGIDEEEYIRKSQNTDIKAIKNLITLKLYAMYYGDAANVPEKSKESEEVSFTMTKKGDSFMVGNDVIYQLVKDSRNDTYGDSSTNQTTSTSSSSYDGTDI